MNHGDNGTQMSRSPRMLVSFYNGLLAEQSNSGMFAVDGNNVRKIKAVPCPICTLPSRTEVHFENGVPVGGHCLKCDSQFVPFYEVINRK